jgi:hypothetical protein
VRSFRVMSPTTASRPVTEISSSTHDPFSSYRACGIHASTASVLSPTGSRYDYVSTSTHPRRRPSGTSRCIMAWIIVEVGDLAYQLSWPRPLTAGSRPLNETAMPMVRRGNGEAFSLRGLARLAESWNRNRHSLGTFRQRKLAIVRMSPLGCSFVGASAIPADLLCHPR